MDNYAETGAAQDLQQLCYNNLGEPFVLSLVSLKGPSHQIRSA